MDKKWNTNAAEKRIYQVQETLIRKRFGKKAADKANYGWGVDGTEDSVDVCTKIYGHGTLTSHARRINPRIAHHWELNE